MGLVDVRDVALAHLKALKVPEAANKRFILCCESWYFHKIGKSLERHWKPQGYTKVTKKEMPKAVVQVGGLFNARVNTMNSLWGKPIIMDNSQSREVLGIEYSRNLRKTINEMVLSMIETGALVDLRPPPLTNFSA